MFEIDHAHYQALIQNPSFVQKHPPQFLEDFGSVYQDNRHLAPFFTEFKAFADDLENPAIIILVKKGGLSFSADWACDTYDKALFDFLIARFSENNELCLPSMEGFETKINALFSGYRIEHPIRYEFCLNEERFRQLPDWRGQTPRGFSIEYYDTQSTAFLKKHDRRYECWFPESKRFAFAALHRGKIVSECFSVFVDSGMAEVGIHTDKRFRRKGLAFLTSAAFVAHCLDNGLVPHWGCDFDNLASVSLAKKLGFELQSEDVSIKITPK